MADAKWCAVAALVRTQTSSLGAMPPRAYHEALWEQVPRGHTPADFALRRDFLLAAVQRGEHVLDVGCGEGHFAAALAAAGATVLAVDVAEEPLRRLREQHPGVEARLVPAEDAWPLSDASFDAVWAGEVIEHVADTAGWLSEVRRVLRPGGRLLVSTPATSRPMLVWLAVSRRAFAARMNPLGDHLRFYSAATLSGLLAKFGFEQISVRAAGGLPGARRVLLLRAVRSRW
jgi:2-polyprenyl-3-methyl-5-hydroxy-6-metoxy-1,4-benzoquinol methylase